MKAVLKTDCGKVRTHNEDSGGIFEQGDRLLAVIADGMGGHRAGDVASQLTLKYLQEKWEQSDDLKLDVAEAVEWLNEAIVSTNQELYRYANEHEECRGMGTTIVAALCFNEHLIVSHVGDSRCYFSDSKGDLKQITEDHSLVNELVKSGHLSKADAEYHPKKHVIVRALGTDPEINIDTVIMTWTDNCKLLLCSDGLSDKLSDKDLQNVLNENASLEEKAEALIQFANNAGGEDNITLAIVEHTDGEDL
ncbi:Stp1/IreP family PP2C-type Ser/Thr phosphatase [Scopulibacillus cellulosilyticus]|uniref:Stp1/IreP family PP2C-type Ser/Thr phosphatase n=1 Tax=Scopulibacillus cellulosilyticus TaxID=2665665 RepID=A0ABW2PTR0_9BACL